MSTLVFAVCVGRKARDGHIGVARLDLSHNGIERDVLYIQFNAQIICQRLRQGSVQAHDIVVLVQELKRRIAGLCRYNEHALGLDGLHAVLLHIAARHCDAVVGFGSGRAGRGRSAYRAGRSRGSGAGRAGTAAGGEAQRHYKRHAYCYKLFHKYHSPLSTSAYLQAGASQQRPLRPACCLSLSIHA